LGYKTKYWSKTKYKKTKSFAFRLFILAYFKLKGGKKSMTENSGKIISTEDPGPDIEFWALTCRTPTGQTIN
jgi:hypothetical protein